MKSTLLLHDGVDTADFASGARIKSAPVEADDVARDAARRRRGAVHGAVVRGERHRAADVAHVQLPVVQAPVVLRQLLHLVIRANTQVSR